MPWTYNEIKDVLRNNRLTRRPYRGLAKSSRSIRLLSNRVRFGRTFPPFYFNKLFAQGADPWRYEGDSISERRKSLLLGLLPAAPVNHILEIGCASGWMTKDLSLRAKRVTAVDCSSVALSLAKERCEACSNIEFAGLDLLTDSIEGNFDFVVCAGVLNFFPRTTQKAICDKIVDSMQPGGRLLLEHLRARMPGSEMTGEELHMLYVDHPNLHLLDVVKEDIYEIILMEHKYDHTPK